MRVLIRLLGYGWRQKWYLVGAYVTMSGATLSSMAVPLLLGSAIDGALESGVQRQLLLLALAILAVSALRGIFGYGQSYLAEAVSQRAAYELRKDIFRKLQALSFGFHDSQKTGDLMSKATADVDAVRTFMSQWILRGLSIVLMLTLVSGIMLTMNWRLALVSIAFLPVVTWRAMSMHRRLKIIWTLVQTETGKMTTVLQENLAGMRVVKAFGARAHEEAKFEERISAVREHTYAATKLFAVQGSIMTLILTLATATILWVGGHEVAAGRLTPGDLAAFIFFMAMLMMPARMIAWLVNTMSRAASAGQRIFDVLDAESPVQEKPGARPLGPVRGHVKFEGVTMSYDSGADVIRSVDFEALPGQLVAVLGAPGSGKSSVVHLIPRFYDVTAGRVSIDGIDVRDVTLESLRKSIGIVLQDVFVFAASVRDNIAYGANDATLEEVTRAAKIALLHDFIQEQRDGYDTWVGERGITLSGGQRQRLAMARTLLIDPPILILDDSTSSVDVGTEYEIQRALAEVVKGRTTFVIAHRLSTVRGADLILVLDHGEIVERGTHKELQARDGYYRKIYDLQLKPQEESVTVDTAASLAGEP